MLATQMKSTLDTHALFTKEAMHLLLQLLLVGGPLPTEEMPNCVVLLERK